MLRVGYSHALQILAHTMYGADTRAHFAHVPMDVTAKKRLIMPARLRISSSAGIVVERSVEQLVKHRGETPGSDEVQMVIILIERDEPVFVYDLAVS